MEYLKIKRKIHAVCVVLCLLFTVNSSLLAELSYAQSTRLSLDLSNVAISDVFASVEKNSEYKTLSAFCTDTFCFFACFLSALSSFLPQPFSPGFCRAWPFLFIAKRNRNS